MLIPVQTEPDSGCRAKGGKGRVQRVQTAYDAMLGSKEPSMMVVGDLSDMKEAANPTLIPLESQKVK